MNRQEASKELGEKEGINQEVHEALSNSKLPVQRLGQGLINDKFYYGTTLIHKGIPVSAIVTSDKKVYLGYKKITFKCASCKQREEKLQTGKYLNKPRKCKCEKIKDQDWEIINTYNPIKNDFGLNYRTEFNDDSIDYMWQTESIKKYVNGNYKKKKLLDIYNEIVEINKKYIDHLVNSSHGYVSCWIIATYCYLLFEQYGRMYNQAERGSGKTKQARVIKNLAHNPMWVTKGTESSIFRDAEATCGTFIVDNMDKLHEDLKRSIEHCIETGWMFDATYRLTNKESGRTEKYLSFTPMALNNIYGLDENTVDKTFEIGMLKSINPLINRTKPSVKSEDWEGIRDSIRYWMLDNWKIVQKAYNEISASFSGREFDVVEGVLVIAKVLGEDIYKELEGYCKDKLGEQLVDLENSASYKVFSYIWTKFYEAPDLQETKIFLGEISNELFDKFNSGLEKGSKEYTNRKRNFSKYIATIIRSVPMFRKGGLSNGRTYIEIKKKPLEQYMKLQHFINEHGVLLTSITSTISTSSLSSTKVEQVEDVEENTKVEQKIIMSPFKVKEVKP